jgi:hypothetical protein
MKPLNLLLSMLAIALLPACQKERPPSLSNMNDCHEPASWTAENTFQHLLGEWEWRRLEQRRNQSVAIPGDDILHLHFLPDSTLLVIEDGITTQTSSWQVVAEDGDYFGVEADPPVEQIRGRILFCEEWVMFNESYLDGWDSYFLRKP